jgi:hypothetical protein
MIGLVLKRRGQIPNPKNGDRTLSYRDSTLDLYPRQKVTYPFPIETVREPYILAHIQWYTKTSCWTAGVTSLFLFISQTLPGTGFVCHSLKNTMAHFLPKCPYKL